MNKYLATVRVGGTSVRTVVFADSPTHARLLLQYQFGMDCITFSPKLTNEAPADYTLLDNLIKTIKPLTPAQSRINNLKQGVERSRTALQAERERQRQRRESERKRHLSQPTRL
jgi:hypothetical protein